MVYKNAETNTDEEAEEYNYTVKGLGVTTESPSDYYNTGVDYYYDAEITTSSTDESEHTATTGRVSEWLEPHALGAL